ncbi:glycosyltransferase family 2 protein [Algibacter miyuki]|uniref:Glycosyltransferase family 2 protein n=1 Tax=Algibacter miyuki TaxID=1306933 RepID=A0ABV5H3L3_9FLAO|nr:glycosyltransferase family A protein [Algibacter miyuki]MDN3666502.1 glycosyltransferase family A protein [Algibacter miyuki]
MIILVHNGLDVIEVLNEDLKPLECSFKTGSISATLLSLANGHKDALLVWCHTQLKNQINFKEFQNIFHHKRIFASYNPSKQNYLPEQIGYVERSCFLNVNKTVTYPTWVTSSFIGGVNTSVINILKNELTANNSFDYFLNSMAKRGMSEGLFCYSEPKLLRSIEVKIPEIKPASIYTLYQFIWQHYKWVWVFFLTLCYIIYEKKLPLLQLVKSLFYKPLRNHFNLEAIVIQSQKKEVIRKEIDVIIPTIGRKKYLYDVLKDLAKQTILPKNVIIVEQNPLETSTSELDYLKTEDWPFIIRHTFTHQAGVCNARNIALGLVTSDWVFFADDDIRFNIDFFEKTFKKITTLKIDVISYLCLQPHQKQTYFKLEQTIVFGSGSSFCSRKAIENLKFNMAYEFGFGEDADFGMQIRNKGFDVFFVPDIKITHLKAPMGGFRTKIKQRWADDVIQPKPSPTVMLLNQTYYTKFQLLGYKLVLGLRYYKNSTIKNPITYIKKYRKQWERSQFWFSELKVR